MKDQGPIRIGDWARASTGSAHPRPVTGKVVGEYKCPTAGWQWVILTSKGKEMWHKTHCTKITLENVSKAAREIAKVADDRPPEPKVYGSGDLD